MQALTCLGSNLLNLGTQTLLAFARGPADQRFVPLRPCCLNDDSPKMGVARLGDPSPSCSLAAGILAGDRSAVSHKLPWTLKPSQRAHFSHDRYRRHLRHATKCLKCLDDLT